LLLPAFDEGLQLSEHREVAAAEFFRREPGDVDREQSVEASQLSPGGSQHALEGLDRFAAPRLCASRRLGHIRDGTLHDGVEQGLAGGEVDVDRGADDAGAASDLLSGSLASASSAASRMAATLRSASARRRLGADASAGVVVGFGIVQ
jgi:hypothetical protein